MLNANVLTIDPSPPRAQAVAIGGGASEVSRQGDPRQAVRGLGHEPVITDLPLNRPAFLEGLARRHLITLPERSLVQGLVCKTDQPPLTDPPRVLQALFSAALPWHSRPVSWPEPHPCAGPEMVLQTDATGVRVDYVSCDGQPEAEAGWQTTRVGAHVRLEQVDLLLIWNARSVVLHVDADLCTSRCA
jgi:hypothetical protein